MPVKCLVIPNTIVQYLKGYIPEVKSSAMLAECLEITNTLAQYLKE